MSTFTIHTVDSAPQDAKPLLEGARESLGFVPNLFGAFAESPPALNAYLTLSGLVENDTDFSPTEAQVVLLAVSAVNGCEYCVAAQTGIAKARKIDDAVVAAIREGRPIDHPKLKALRRFAETVVEKRGWADASDVRAFLDAGYTKRHVLEVILGVTMKTLSNYVNHIGGIKLDRQFQPARWEKPAGVGA
jgi:uncharacterized peroxidase-related enzyme